MAFSRDYKEVYAAFLIKMAWSLEIVAVLIGLMISLVVSINASQSYTNGMEGAGFLGTTSNMLVAGLPFVLVAIVELCKIPLTFTFMAVSDLKWRLIFAFFVFFLCLITFETMVNGFERNFANLNYAIDTRKNQIENINSEIGLLDIRKARVQTIIEEELLAEVDAQQADINSSYSESVKRINVDTKSVLEKIDYSFREEIEAEIDQLMARRDEYYVQWNSEREALDERFSKILLGNISDSRGERERLVAELDALKREKAARLSDATFLTRAGIEKRFDALITAKDKQIADIATGYMGGDALTKQAVMEEQFKAQTTFMNAKYQGRIDEANARIAAKKQEILDKEQANIELESNVLANADKSKSRYLGIKRDAEKQLNTYFESKSEELAEILRQVREIEDKVFRLKNDQRNIQAEINLLISQNQVYRIAMYAYGKESPVDVERQMVAVVALIWFGSLALIASVTGVMLSLAGFYLRRVLLDKAESMSPSDV